jgi:formylglycine-generating enzyme required for sulfatase activity
VDSERKPRLIAQPLAPATYWQALARSDVRATPPVALEDGPVDLPEWSGRPAELARARALAEWRDLLPRLRRAVAEQDDTRALDLPAIVLTEPPELQSRALALQRAWRAGLPPEIWLAEVQALPARQRVRLVDPADARESAAFVAALGRQAAGVRGAAPVAGAIPWFRDVAAWLPTDCVDDPELGEYYYRIWEEILRRDPHQSPPAGLRPERLRTAKPARRVALSQRGGMLQALATGEAAGGAGYLGTVLSANGLIRLEIPYRPDDPAAFWETSIPPTWADAWGWDEYGAWVEFSVEASDGVRVTQRMRWIAPGRFLMGSPEDEPERYDDEGPQHEVTLAEGFWLFDTACTQALWAAVLGENPSRFQDPQRPVEQVSWEDVQARFLPALNARIPGLALGLPSEAQWEYACRAGTETPFSFGVNITPEQVNYNGEYPYAGGPKGRYRAETVPVESLPANPWGLDEMHGNVDEWVQYTWHDSYERAPKDGCAWESKEPGLYRVIRGGSWNYTARNCRSAVRRGGEPGYRDSDLGFRCARVQGREPVGQGAERASLPPPGPRSGSGRAAAGSARAAVPDVGDYFEQQPSVLLRLDAEGQADTPLPRVPALRICTDREHLNLRRISRPAWASAMGRDRFGLWSEITVEAEEGAPVVQRLRWIPPGRFQMGSPKDEPGCDNDEGPRHEVLLGQGYWLFDTPCTQALWAAVMGENPSRFQDPQRPVEQVSWEDVQARFLPALNARIPGFVLPSEAQWEYACRAGTETALCTGPIEILGRYHSPALDPIAWYGGNSGVDYDLREAHETTGDWWEEMQYPTERAGTRKVRGKAPNAWGLYDTLGNVWEWCEDSWHDSYAGAPADGAPRKSDSAGAPRVIRGGSWSDPAQDCRSAVRYGFGPVDRNFNLGFRCARAQAS